MSVVTVAQVKKHLRQFHDMDDNLLQMLLDGAEDELKRYLDRDELPRRDDGCAGCESDSTLDPASDSDDLAPSVRMAVFCYVQAMYDGTSPEDQIKLREAGRSMCVSYRCQLGA
ncbi:head-tail connector protein [Lysobacter sp. 5GHs7-4]|uniref:head-tail connector protein n=1 Tax=Lysobacter sp. 5GHs7-4 TaxID=2904253 RepID=UPI001E452A09|nr:head-tail connector protein [Lysobacter sp. 5GHs7-4]UHQ21890.1 head-tail connector protein [Lysobacter sp. 5GHs7-4]